MSLSVCLWTAEGQSAEPASLRIGGFSRWWVVGVWQQSAWQQAQAADFNSVDVKGDNEIHFTGRFPLTNGSVAGIQVELEAGGHRDQTTDTIDKSFLWIENRWGKLEFGTDYNAASQLHICAPDAAGLWNGPSMGVMSDNVIALPDAVSPMWSGNQTELDQDLNAEKLVYFTPSLSGLTAAFSYTPDARSEDNREAAFASPVYAAGLLYEREINGLGLKASAGILTGTLRQTVSDSRASVLAWSGGLNLTLAGWTVGASFAKEQHHPPEGAAKDDSGRSWDFGLQYGQDAWQLSAAWYRSQVEGSTANAGQDRVIVQQISGRYRLGSGVALLGSAARLSYGDESAGPDNNNRGYSLMSGLALSY